MTTLDPPVHHISHADRERILAYYRMAQPLILQHFGGSPMVYGAYPRGLENYVVYHGVLHAKPPGNLRTIEVRTGAGMRSFVELSQRSMTWMLAHTSAVEFYGWGCVAHDPTRARFARILLELDLCNRESIAGAARILRDRLNACNLQAIPIDAGGRGVALWVPLSGAPPYEAVRAWLHEFCAAAVAVEPRRFTLEPNTIDSGRVHLHVTSNTPGRFSALPYSLRGDADLPVCAPLRWDELDAGTSRVTIEAASARIARLGDIFADELARIGEQSLPEAASHRSHAHGTPTLGPAAKHARPIEPQGHTLRAVAEILQDGRPRDARQILTEAVARGLLPPQTKERWIYTALIEYIVRTGGHGHKPFVVQDSDRRFRLNEPRDDWPVLDPPPAPPPDSSTQAVIDRLAQTAHGHDPVAFELAVCDAFAHLGFVATHVGGYDNTDGYTDAPLGALGYRTMLECKSGAEVVHEADAVEAAKYKDRFGAQFCALVGSKFTQDLELAGELQTHGVAAFSLDDLLQLLRVRSNPYEMRALFEPGFVSDRIGDMLWERLHGTPKRVSLIARYLHEEGWTQQLAFAKTGPVPAVSQAPRLTVDAAMLLVDQRLSDEGAHAACTRPEVEAAFAYLTSPLVGTAAWLDDRHDALVVCAAPGL